MCIPFDPACTSPDVHPRACTDPFQCVHLVHASVRLWTFIQVPILAFFGVYALRSRMYVCGHASPCPCVRMCMPLYKLPRVCTGLFRCVRLVHVCVHLWTFIHVPVPPHFGVYALCTCVNASGRSSTCLYRPFSVCTPCACVCTPLDVHPRLCTGFFRCLRPLNVCVCLCTCIQVPVQALLGVYFLCTCVYAFIRASTCLYRPFLVCTHSAHVCMTLDVHSRTCTGFFRCVHPVHVPVRL